MAVPERSIRPDPRIPPGWIYDAGTFRYLIMTGCIPTILETDGPRETWLRTWP